MTLLRFFAISILVTQHCQSALDANTTRSRDGNKSYELYDENNKFGIEDTSTVQSYKYIRSSTSTTINTGYSNQQQNHPQTQSRSLSVSRFFQRVGERITDFGETSTDEKNVGETVSMSDDGSVIAVSGIITQSASNEHSFFIKVYTLIDESWELKGQAIQNTDSSIALDDSRAHVCLSGDGGKLAVSTIYIKDRDVPNRNWKGTVKVYDYNSISNQWVVGSTMYEGDGGKSGYHLGLKASLDTTGSIIAIGIQYHDDIVDDVGQVQVCKVGDPGSCQTLSDESSTSKNVGADVQITGNSAQYPCVVLGAPGTGESAGSISVLCDENNSGVWTNRPFKDDARFGEYDGDNFGGSVAISADGNFVAAGAWENDGAASEHEDVGSVRVYQFVASTGEYERLGGDIDGERGGKSEPNSKYYVGDASGFSIALSNKVDGIIRVAIGAPNNPGADLYNGYYNGHVRLYECYLDNGATPSWNRVLGDLDGSLQNESFGHSVAMNRDGTRVVVGSPGYGSDSNGYYAGAVIVYDLLVGSGPSKAPSPSPSISPSSTPSFVPSSNPSNAETTIESSPQKLIMNGVRITEQDVNKPKVIAAFTQTVTEALLESIHLGPNESLEVYEVALTPVDIGEASRRRGLQSDGGNQVYFFFRYRIITRNPSFVIPQNVTIDALANPEYVAVLRNALVDPETGESAIDENANVELVEDVADSFQIKTNHQEYDFEGNTTWCLTAEQTQGIGITSLIKVRRCDPSNKLQIWSLDDLDQLKLVALPLNLRCIKSQSFAVFMDTCEITKEETLSWFIENEKGGQVIKQSKFNRFAYVGIEYRRKYAKVRLFREDSGNDSLGEWELLNGYFSFSTEVMDAV